MKTLMMTIGLFLSITLMANGERPIKKEVEKKFSLNLKDYNYHENYEDFVLVNFKVENQKIKINDASGTDQWLIESVKKELSQMMLENNYPDHENYNIKFIFSKR